MLMFRHKKNF